MLSLFLPCPEAGRSVSWRDRLQRSFTNDRTASATSSSRYYRISVTSYRTALVCLSWVISREQGRLFCKDVSRRNSESPSSSYSLPHSGMGEAEQLVAGRYCSYPRCSPLHKYHCAKPESYLNKIYRFKIFPTRFRCFLITVLPLRPF